MGIVVGASTHSLWMNIFMSRIASHPNTAAAHASCLQAALDLPEKSQRLRQRGIQIETRDRMSVTRGARAAIASRGQSQDGLRGQGHVNRYPTVKPDFFQCA